MKKTALIMCMVVVFFLTGINVFTSEAMMISPIATMNMYMVNNWQAQRSINIKPAAFLRMVNIPVGVKNEVPATPVEDMGSKVNNVLTAWTTHMPIPVDMVDAKGTGSVFIWQVFSKSF